MEEKELIAEEAIEEINLDEVEITEENKEYNIGIDEDEDIMSEEE